MYKIKQIAEATVVFELYEGGKSIIKNKQDELHRLDQSYEEVQELVDALENDTHKDFVYVYCAVSKSGKKSDSFKVIVELHERTVSELLNDLMDDMVMNDSFEMAEMLKRVVSEI